MAKYVEIFGVWFNGGSVETREDCVKILRTLSSRISRSKSEEEAEELRNCREEVAKLMAKKGWSKSEEKAKYVRGVSFEGMEDSWILGGKKSWACRRNSVENEEEYWRYYVEDAKRKGWGDRMIVKNMRPKHGVCVEDLCEKLGVNV